MDKQIVKSFSCGNVLALGNFDGVHVGHQQVLRVCAFWAKCLESDAADVLFRPHPAIVLSNKARSLLMAYDSRNEAIKKLGIKVIEIDFDIQLASLSHIDFVKDILVNKLQAKHVVTGSNFCYGHSREGNTETLSKSASCYGFGYSVVNQVFVDHQQVSSTLIKEKLKNGFIESANRMLGKPYNFAGQVIKSWPQLIAQSTYTTISLLWPLDQAPVMPGIYFGSMEVAGGVYFALVNIRTKQDDDCSSGVKQDIIHEVELSIFDTHENFYGVQVKIDLLSFIRPERRFNSPMQLQNQTKADFAFCRDLYKLKHKLPSCNL